MCAAPLVDENRMLYTNNKTCKIDDVLSDSRYKNVEALCEIMKYIFKLS